MNLEGHEDSKLTLTLSATRRVNLGNYESADVFVSVSGVTDDTTPEEIAALLDGPGKATYDLLRARVERMAAARKAGA